MAEKKLAYWKAISPKKVMESVNWALDNWEPNTKIDHSWDQVIQSTWSKLNAYHELAKKQILADWEACLLISKEEE